MCIYIYIYMCVCVCILSHLTTFSSLPVPFHSMIGFSSSMIILFTPSNPISSFLTSSHSIPFSISKAAYGPLLSKIFPKLPQSTVDISTANYAAASESEMPLIEKQGPVSPLPKKGYFW